MRFCTQALPNLTQKLAGDPAAQERDQPLAVHVKKGGAHSLTIRA